jgi:predicted DNA-binding transcriptional regulator AlpA
MTQNSSLPDPLLDKAAVADFVGVCPRTIERYVRDGQFPPPIRLGGSRRWRRSKIEAFLREQEEAAATQAR